MTAPAAAPVPADDPVLAALLLDTRGRPRVHNRPQLREALRLLGLDRDEFERAEAAGLIPAPDRPSGTWSGPLVEQIARDAARIRAAIPDDLNAGQLRATLGLDYGPWARGRAARLIPDPDRGQYWTRATAEGLLARIEEIRENIPLPAALGAFKCAEMLAELTGAAVQYADVVALVALGKLTVVGEYKDNDLLDVDELRALAADEEGRALIAAAVCERESWVEASISLKDAAAMLKWSTDELARVLKERSIEPGPRRRYPLAAITALAADEGLGNRVRGRRELGTEQAVDYLGVRATEFAIMVDNGWISAGNSVDIRVGRKRWITAPLYRIDELESVDERLPPDVSLPELRALGPGEPSPLRAYAKRRRRAKASTTADAAGRR